MDIKKAAFLPVSVLLLSLLFPGFAFAAEADGGSTIALVEVIALLEMIATNILLPICIVLVSWRAIYIALFCGMAGCDPLNMGKKLGRGGRDNPLLINPWLYLKGQLWGFAKGIAWVAGVWVIFEVVCKFAQFAIVMFSNAGVI